MTTTGKIVAVNGNMITVAFDGAVAQNEVGYAVCGDKRLMAEIPELRFALDTGNLYYAGRGDDILDVMEYAGARVSHIHLKDQMADDNHKFVTLGTGVVPNEQIVKASRSAGYSGWYTLEEPVGDDVLSDISRQIEVLKVWHGVR